jgi:hypothetical protein
MAEEPRGAEKQTDKKGVEESEGGEEHVDGVAGSLSWVGHVRGEGTDIFSAISRPIGIITQKKSMRFGIYYHCNRIVSFMIDQACLSLVFDAKYCSSRRRCLLCGQKSMHKYLVRTINLINFNLPYSALTTYTFLKGPAHRQ